MKNRALKKSGEFKPESEIIKLINLFNSLN
jgi:hypothetical protein